MSSELNGYDPDEYRQVTDSVEAYEAFQEMDEFVFAIGDKEFIKLCSNGDIYIKGKLAENDKDVVAGMKSFLRSLDWDEVDEGIRRNEEEYYDE